MAKTKSQSKKNDAAAVLTAAEYLKYIEHVHDSILGLAELVKEATAGGYPQSAGLCPLETSRDALQEIMQSLQERFKEAHGKIPYHLEDGTVEITIAAGDVDSYRKAIGPAVAFIELASNHDFDSEDETVGNIGNAGALVDEIALEGLALFQSRLKEGGTQ